MRKRFRSSAIVSLIAIVAMALGLSLASSASASASTTNAPLTANQTTTLLPRSGTWQTVTVINVGTTSLKMENLGSDCYSLFNSFHRPCSVIIKPGATGTLYSADRIIKNWWSPYAVCGYYEMRMVGGSLYYRGRNPVDVSAVNNATLRVSYAPKYSSAECR